MSGMSLLYGFPYFTMDKAIAAIKNQKTKNF